VSSSIQTFSSPRWFSAAFLKPFSGDRHLLQLVRFQNIGIVGVRKFMDILNPTA